MQRAIKAVKDVFPDLVVIADVCVCAYTDHGHCGSLNKNGEVENDITLDTIQKTACSMALAGADMVAPSGMMDGRFLQSVMLLITLDILTP